MGGKTAIRRTRPVPYHKRPRPVDLASLPVTLTVEEFGIALRIGRNRAYRWAKEHPDEVLHLGANTIRIPKRIVEEMLGERDGA